MNDLKKVCRRTAIKSGAATLVAAPMVLGQAPATKPIKNAAPTGPGHVVKIHMPGMRIGIHPHPDAARIMVDKAVATLARESDIKKAWLKFITPGEKIGLKVNCLGTRMVSTQREVTYATAASLNDAGVPNEDILIIDMFASNMMGGRYDQQPNPRKIRVLAHKESSYDDMYYKAGPARARFSKAYTELDAVINMPPIKDHDLVGVTCCMKNVTFGVVEKPHINHVHANLAIPHLWALDVIRKKVRLNLIDGSTILYEGGPKFTPGRLVPHESIYATTDPVAMDSLANEMIAKLRTENELRSLKDVGRPAEYLKLAEQMGLGIADQEKLLLETVTLPRFTGTSA